jgi:hypothetical protein
LFFSRFTMKTKFAISVLIMGAALASGGTALASGNTSYGVPTPPGPFVNPEPGSPLPDPRNVPGKEFSTQFDLNTNATGTPGQSLFWDGLGGTANAIQYSATRQLDALANEFDALFDAVRQNATNLLFSIQGDFGERSIYAIDPTGKISLWANNDTINSPPPSAFDLDALEIWGPDQVANGNMFSLEADVLPDGLSSASVIKRMDNGSVQVKYDRLAIATAIGRPDLEDVIDLDALMVKGDSLLFSIRPISEFDGGEIWDWSGSGPASFLSFGGNTWNTGFNLQSYFAGQGFAINTENIDALEAASVPGPLPVLGVSAAFGWSRRLRKRSRQAGELADLKNGLSEVPGSLA